ncbi:DNA polymerase IV [bacterium]|nr:DNA polymerase IV [bacterium]
MIAHFDMDCFYAAVEMRDKPYLRGKPIAVGGKSQRGILTTCNYEARKFGVRSAMPVGMAKKLCPDLVCLGMRFDVYREESRKIQSLIKESHSQVMMTSVDEGYLELSYNPQVALEEARKLKALILHKTGLVVSIGIAPNKMLAKIAGALKKPDALNLVTAEEAATFMAEIPLGKIPGVGPKAQEILAKHQLHIGRDLQRLSGDEAFERLGDWGLELREKVFGGNLSPQKLFPENYDARPQRKSVSLERTLESNIMTYDEIEALIPGYYAQLKGRVGQYRGKRGNTESSKDLIAKAFVKLKFDDFSQTTCERSFDVPGEDMVDQEFFKELFFEALARSTRAVRLVGMGIRFHDEPISGGSGSKISGLRSGRRDPRQLDLFSGARGALDLDPDLDVRQMHGAASGPYCVASVVYCVAS